MTIWFGGDYNPEQWPESVWDEDIALMQRARVTLVTVGVFSWAKLEPSEGVYTFGWLDRIMDKLHAAGIRVDLATATASPPPWLTHRYPEVLPVTENGVRLQVGSRQQYCPSSPVYRRLAQNLVTAIVDRYASHPALEMWHINNEYGCHLSRCYCDVSAAAFRVWLQRRYRTIDQLNETWGTAFWSQWYGSFDEVYTPSRAPYYRNPGQVLDFDRFSSDELLDCFREEAAVVRAGSPRIPLTTNFMGFFKPVDYWAWASELDLICDDSYPDPSDPRSPMLAAMSRDLMRSLAAGKPWILMEQAASAVNWRDINVAKPAGMMRALSLQAVARGADGVLFFQWRQSDRGGERFHSAMLPHAGTETVSWRAIEALGHELDQHSDVVEGAVVASVAMVFEWDSWWSLEQDGVPARLSYLALLQAWYLPFFEAGITVDFVTTQSDLSGYSLVIVAGLFAVNPSELSPLHDFADRGGQLIVSFQSAIVDRTGRLMPGGFLGPLAGTLGVRIDEFTPIAAGTSAEVEGGIGSLWAERIVSIDSEILVRFTDGDLAGSPAVTRRRVGQGTAHYFATMPDPELLATLIQGIVAAAGIPAREGIPSGTEVVKRGTVTYVINHREGTVDVEVMERSN